MKLSVRMQQALRCPVCFGPLQLDPERASCVSPDCRSDFPIVDGIPLLLDETRSVFTIEGVRTGGPAAFDSSKQSEWRRRLRDLLPRMDRNLCSVDQLRRLRDVVLAATSRPAVLVLGGGILGEGIEALVGEERIELVESDIFLGPRTVIVLDAHQIPFADGSFDAVVAQAVLEHVVDPYGCVEEMWRVLKPGGLAYAETPFMQQVHGGRYDFTRFTLLGHRRLFRRFDEVDSGIAVGPGSALAWSWTYFLGSFLKDSAFRPIAHLLGRSTGFFWKYADRLLSQREGAFDAASGFYFLGRKAPDGWMLSDRELLKMYRGVHD
jgi:SAM-dependent methyltransferase/uncharacterized protein YbaR (Trm112 family)